MDIFHTHGFIFKCECHVSRARGPRTRSFRDAGTYVAARYSGVWPRWLAARASAPMSTTKRATSRRPFDAAEWSGVLQFSSAALTSLSPVHQQPNNVQVAIRSGKEERRPAPTCPPSPRNSSTPASPLEIPDTFDSPSFSNHSIRAHAHTVDYEARQPTMCT